ncbi:MAG: hypothetical protein BWZ01_02994 [Deltaproteobacteria bacterium ADurb.BinA179]|nr:MAG: hypothetical protein BWZ01_02994 [Deltaproteobacteria bacterium ADurb.BinA179]
MHPVRKNRKGSCTFCFAITSFKAPPSRNILEAASPRMTVAPSRQATPVPMRISRGMDRARTPLEENASRRMTRISTSLTPKVKSRGLKGMTKAV